MQKIIEPPKQSIVEHYCDGCQKLIIVSGIPLDSQPESGKQVCVALQGSFCYTQSELVGLAFDHIYCDDCATRLVKLIENEFKIKIESNIFDKEVFHD